MTAEMIDAWARAWKVAMGTAPTAAVWGDPRTSLDRVQSGQAALLDAGRELLDRRLQRQQTAIASLATFANDVGGRGFPASVPAATIELLRGSGERLVEDAQEQVEFFGRYVAFCFDVMTPAWGAHALTPPGHASSASARYSAPQRVGAKAA